MKTRRRTATAARQATNVPKNATAENIVNPAFGQSLVQLTQESFTVLNVPVSTVATLTIAGKALQGQLEVYCKQPAHSTYAGYTSLQGKQWLEYWPGDAVIGDLSKIWLPQYDCSAALLCSQIPLLTPV